LKPPVDIFSIKHASVHNVEQRSAKNIILEKIEDFSEFITKLPLLSPFLFEVSLICDYVTENN